MVSDQRWYDLVEAVDDASSETYYAQLVVEESRRTVMAALKEVIERQGRFGALYRNSGEPLFRDAESGRAGGPAAADAGGGRALKEPGIPMIPAYSPQARGRSERRFATWQGRLPPQLRLAGIRTVEEANRFLTSVPEMNRKFSVPAAEKAEAFVGVQGQDVDRIFSVQQEQVVAKDNTAQWGERIGRTPWRRTLPAAG